MILVVVERVDRLAYLRADLERLDAPAVVALVRSTDVADEIAPLPAVASVEIVERAEAWSPSAVTSRVDRLADRARSRGASAARVRQIESLEWRLRGFDRVARFARAKRSQRQRTAFPSHLESSVIDLLESRQIDEVWLYDAWVAAAIVRACEGTQVSVSVR